VSSDAQAASLSLECTGTVTTSNVPKDGVVPDPDKDNVSDYSVETSTTGMIAAQTALPITQANATGIYFVARRKQSAIGESIYAAQLTPLRVQRQRADHRMGFALQANAPAVAVC
jgi:hypothetical protein